MSRRALYKHIFSVTMILATLVIAGCTDSTDRQTESQTGIAELQKQGRRMPSFDLPSPASEEYGLSGDSLRGKVVLVAFFASWCRSCIEEIPLLKKLQNRFEAQDFIIIAMAVDRENKTAVKNLIEKHGINYPILLADETVKKDFGGIAILPTMFLVNRDGILLKKYTGHIERDSLIHDIKQTLNR